jgi:hypothetical protein
VVLLHTLPDVSNDYGVQNRPKQVPFGGGCEGGVRLLKFLVCWDAAVCAVNAGGFFYVWNGVRKTNDWNGVRKTNDWNGVRKTNDWRTAFLARPPRVSSSAVLV